MEVVSSLLAHRESPDGSATARQVLLQEQISTNSFNAAILHGRESDHTILVSKI